MARYYVGLGSNLGARQSFLRSAIRAIAELGRIEAVSSLYETAPVGPPQPDYLNGALALRSDLAPHAVMERLLAIERMLGRERRERWGPRTIDLDLIAYDGAPIHSEALELPHPRWRERAFVVAPLGDVAPELSLQDLLRDLGGRPPRIEWNASDESLETLARELEARWLDPEAAPLEARVIPPQGPLPSGFRVAAVAVPDAERAILVGASAAKVL